MEKSETAKPTLGTWDRLPTEQTEKFPKVTFEINIPQEVIFLTNEPKEFQGDNGVYYVFEVEQNKQKKVIMASAWTLLRELKLLGKLAGKRVKIEKKLEKGKQQFKVELIK